MTITNFRKSRIFKVTNITLIYVLLLDITVPFAQTMEKVSVFPENKYSGLELFPSNTYLNKEISERPAQILEEISSTDLPITQSLLAPESELAIVNTTAAPGAGSSGFSINDNDQLIDPFTGDFSYSIPLMDVEGYPITLNYNSNVTMNSEASWVGLGWNLNVGSVEREMRGIPDEFDGTQSVTREMNQLNDVTSNGFKSGRYWDAGININLANYVSLNLGYNNSKLRGSYYNTYLGSGRTFDKVNGWNAGVGASIYFVGLSIGGSGSKYFSYDSKRGINMGVGGGLSGGITLFGVGPNFSTYSSKNYNSREGMTGKTINRGWGLSAGTVISMSRSHTSTIAYGSQTQIPRVQVNSVNMGATTTIDRYFLIGVGLGSFAKLGATYGRLKQYYSSARSNIKNGNLIIQPAIGYLHSSKKMHASGYTLPIMDFNRSNDTRYSDAMTNLPFSMQTFDIFYANALGMQGTFRAHRTDAGTYVDAFASDNDTEITVTDKKGGSITTYEKETGIGLTKTATESKVFEKFNDTKILEFSENVAANGFDDAIYFKGVGEATPVDESLYKNLGGLYASRATLLNDGNEIALQEVMVANNGTNFTLPPDGKVSLTKPVVATHFQPKTVQELNASPVNYDKYYYNYGSGANPSITPIARTTKASNIISRVDVVSDEGTFYSYGIPAFSNSSSQVLFNIGSNSGSPSISTDAQGLVTYASGDNSVSNSKGLSHYYDKTTVPTYAESFLLTDMYGSDYVDRTGDGPTLDDIGTYYKFNYTLLYENYHWRFPIGNQKAFYMEGTVGSELDDMATYTAGNKQIWVTHSVESKNYIAEFILDAAPREDGYGIDENGNKITTEKTYALKRIELYTRADRKAYGSSAKPIQVVEFNYNYELCQNFPSNSNTNTAQRGKLTLKSVSMYTGKSFETQQNSFQFDYGSGPVSNPDFNYGTVDAWGELKPGSPVYNSRHPYVTQSQTSADNNAQAWKLKQIISPNGGQINIAYEADRYGFVQDKRVMKHMQFEGLMNIFDLFSSIDNHSLDLSQIRQTMNTPSAAISTYAQAASQVNLKYNVQYGKFNPSQIPNNIVVFKLDTPIPSINGSANQKVKEDYFMDNGIVMKELYLKAHIRVRDNDVTRTEIVPTFVAISEDLQNALSNTFAVDEAPAIGVLPPLSGSSDYTYGYVVLTPHKVRNPKEEDLDNGADQFNDNIWEDEAFNPIQKAAFDFFQRSLADIVYQNTAFSTGQSSLDLLTGARMDVNKAMRALNFGTTLVSDYNTMRVYIPSNIKYGGGSRVKSIEVSDNWNAISSEYTSKYKTNYLYDFDGKTSGVASYESRAANDECSLYQWDSYYDIKVRFPDKFNYTPKPVMELLYPSGSVGYSKVAVQYNDLTDRGYLVSEFYTAYDKPVEESFSGLQKQVVDQIWPNSGESRKICGFSQGYSIETNDFHGKIKSNTVYKGDISNIANSSNASNIISQSIYEYFGAGEKQKLADQKGDIQEIEVGMDYDIHADARVISNVISSAYVAIQKVWAIPSPFPFPHYISNDSYAYSAFYSHVLVKHANRSAILKKVTTTYMQSTNSAENLVFDRYSGNVILSSLNDEFNDPLYSLSYPAHWYYPELRNISSSQDRTLVITLGANTTITDPATIAKLTPGDRIKFPNGTYAWVAKSYPWPSTPKYFLITEAGTELSMAAGSYSVTIIKSGRSNELTASMQDVVTKKNPLDAATPNKIIFPSTGILSASAITLRDKLNVLCKAAGSPDPVNNNNSVAVGIVNPYLYGVRGDLIPENELTWQSSRIQATTTDGVRKDGAYSSFIPYYAKNTTNGEWYPLTHSSHPNYAAASIQNWRKSGESTLNNQYGAQIEVRDPLQINSALLYGYNPELQLLPIAMAQNAHKQDIAFDGFEDYGYYVTQAMDDYEPHFSFTGMSPNKLMTSSEFRHSGKNSVLLPPGEAVTATRTITPFQEAKTVHADNTTNTGQTQDCDCIHTFSPTPGEYVVSAWVKQPNNTDGKIEILAYNASNAVVLNSILNGSGTSLDGWQRIEGTLIIPSNATKITVSLKNSNSTGVVYFDDFRMHPFTAGMVTTVYDPRTLLKIASHDGYNYTTFYNYDENNQLVRVRVETSEGIKTISETELSIYKQP